MTKYRIYYTVYLMVKGDNKHFKKGVKKMKKATFLDQINGILLSAINEQQKLHYIIEVLKNTKGGLNQEKIEKLYTFMKEKADKKTYTLFLTHFENLI